MPRAALRLLFEPSNVSFALIDDLLQCDDHPFVMGEADHLSQLLNARAHSSNHIIVHIDGQIGPPSSSRKRCNDQPLTY